MIVLDELVDLRDEWPEGFGMLFHGHVLVDCALNAEKERRSYKMLLTIIMFYLVVHTLVDMLQKRSEGYAGHVWKRDYPVLAQFIALIRACFQHSSSVFPFFFLRDAGKWDVGNVEHP